MRSSSSIHAGEVRRTAAEIRKKFAEHRPCARRDWIMRALHSPSNRSGNGEACAFAAAEIAGRNTALANGESFTQRAECGQKSERNLTRSSFNLHHSRFLDGKSDRYELGRSSRSPQRRFLQRFCRVTPLDQGRTLIPAKPILRQQLDEFAKPSRIRRFHDV